MKRIAISAVQKRVLANFKHLVAIQGVNMLAPMLTLPYLARVLGFDGLGLLATAAATSAIFGILIDWGFNLTAVRSVSRSRENLEEVSRIFSTVTTVKITFMAFSAFVLLIICFTIPSINQNYLVFIFSFTFTSIQALLPIWIFQGLEQMSLITVINTFSKIISTVLVLMLVNKSSDVVLAPLINTLIALISVAVTFQQLYVKYNIRFIRPETNAVLRALKDGSAIFTATAAGYFYSQGPVLILNVFTDLATIGKYSIAQKLSSAAVSIFQSLSQAIFPSLSRLWIEAPSRTVVFTYRYIVATQIFSLIVFGLIFTFSPHIYFLFTASSDAIGIETIRYWLVISQLIVLSVALSPVIVSIGKDRDMAKIYIFCSSAFILYSWILTSLYQLKGMLISMLIIETTIALSSLASFIYGSKTKSEAGCEIH